MATNKPCIEIPNRFKSLNNSEDPAIAHIVAGADDIFDDSQNRKQDAVNADVARHETEINDPTNGLKKRVDDIEAMSQVGDTPTENDATMIINNDNLNGKLPTAPAVNGVYNALDAKTGLYTCQTGAGEPDKTVTAPGYVLSAGGSIKILMANANSASNVTLNINTRGAKALYYNNAPVDANNTWEAGETVEVYYNGTNERYYANNVAGGAGDGVFDVSAKTGNSYATLGDALTDAASVIPASKKKGGMSITFIDSNSGEYVQYRLMVADWSINTDDWSFCGDDVLMENPEFMAVYTDSEGRIIKAIKKDGTEMIATSLEVHGDINGIGMTMIENPEFAAVWLNNNDKIIFGVQKNGNFYFGAGVPLQVISYIESRIEDLSLDEYEDIVAFLNGFIGNNKPTLATLLNNLGLYTVSETYADFAAVLANNGSIPSEYRKPGMTVRFNRQTQVGVDGNDNPIYSYEYEQWIYTGTAVTGTPNPFTDISNWIIVPKTTEIDNPEYLKVITDSDKKVIQGIKPDGTTYIGGGVEVNGDINIPNESIQSEDNPEYLKVTTDSEGHILDGIKKDGTHYIHNVQSESIDAKVDKEEGKSLIDAGYAESVSLVDSPEYVETKTDSEGKVLAGRTPDGAAFENVGLSTPKTSIGGHTINNIKDIEGRTKILTDSDNKIISYRDANGVKHENVGIETNHIGLSESGMTEFQQALKDSGFTSGGAVDYSDKITKKGENPAYIPTPRCAYLNILWDGDLTQLSKEGYTGSPVPVQKVNYDVKVEVEFFDGQGIYFKKWAFIGAQGNSSMGFDKKNISLKIFDTKDVEGKKKKWGKGDTFGIKFGDWVMQKSFHLKAYCTNIFRGEPVVGYQIADKIMRSREFDKNRPWKIGLLGNYTFTDNSDTSAQINDMSLQMDNGARCIPDGFPVIVYQKGVFYGIFSWQIKKDADNYHMDTDNAVHIHLDGTLNGSTIWNGTIDWTAFEIRCPEDLVDINGNDYDGDNPTEIEASDTKTAIINLSTRCAEITAAVGSDAKKALINTYFDKDNIIDYIIFSQLTANYDGFEKNWQWVTYDGVKWFICPYDLDGIFGCNFVGTFVEPAEKTFRDTYAMESYINGKVFLSTVYNLYLADVKSRYNELRTTVGINPEYVLSLICDWANRVGVNNYQKEYSKWSNAECNRDSVINDGWELVDGEYFGSSPSYDAATTYQANDTCWAGYRKWKATREIQGVYPFVQLGYHDSIYRLKEWIDTRFQLLDNYYNNL